MLPRLPHNQLDCRRSCERASTGARPRGVNNEESTFIERVKQEPLRRRAKSITCLRKCNPNFCVRVNVCE